MKTGEFADLSDIYCKKNDSIDNVNGVLFN